MAEPTTRFDLLPLHARTTGRAGRTLLLLGATAALGTPAITDAAEPEVVYGTLGVDDLPDPMTREERGLRKTALEEMLKGESSSSDGVHRVANGQYVELDREGEDLILTILVEFGNAVSEEFGGLEGPLHNEIPEPDPAYTNDIMWTDDFDRSWYMDMLFSEGSGQPSMRDYWIEVSSNRYTVDGDVTDWVGVDGNAAWYGNNYCGWVICDNTSWLVEDAVDNWYQGLLDDGWTPAEIDAYLGQYDVWDRYDWDGDGDFDEPDGYIDRFQVVHAGVGEEFGGGAYGSDAQWSHSWYVYPDDWGSTGPSTDYLLGGVQIGASSYWVGKYTMMAEDSGLGVFTHEYGHDLGLPDLYDTSGSGDGAPGHWTLMAVGSHLSDGVSGLTTMPGHLGAWEKLQLGWLDYEIAFAGEKSEHKLGPSITTTKAAQALVVVLPDRERIVDLGEPHDGDRFYYSGKGDNLFNYMLRPFDVDASSTLHAWVRYDIETDWDYAFLVATTDLETVYVLPTNLSSSTDPNGNNFALTGITGSTGGDWVELEAPVGYFDGEVYIGFAYLTDEAVQGDGFQVDDIDVSGYDTDGAEGDESWLFEGFSVADGPVSMGSYFNAYIAEYRQYVGFDAALETGPFVGVCTTADCSTSSSAFYPYQDGLLISYWDAYMTDDNVSWHPGEGLILPVDAHPDTLNDYPAMWQIYDATFGLDDTDPFDIELWGMPLLYEDGQDAVPVFDDTDQYYRETAWPSGVINPHTGTQIRVKSVSAHGSFMQVEVRPVE